MSSIIIKQVTSADPDLHILVTELDDYLYALYPADGVFSVDFESEEIREMTFFLAYENRTPAGCGALRPLEHTVAEIKRFYVREAYRGRGIADTILQTLESAARDQHYHSIRLETGPEQRAAIRLYERNDYRRIENFGEYAGCEYSLCYEKFL